MCVLYHEILIYVLQFCMELPFYTYIMSRKVSEEAFFIRYLSYYFANPNNFTSYAVNAYIIECIHILFMVENFVEFKPYELDLLLARVFFLRRSNNSIQNSQVVVVVYDSLLLCKEYVNSIFTHSFLSFSFIQFFFISLHAYC